MMFAFFIGVYPSTSTSLSSFVIIIFLCTQEAIDTEYLVVFFRSTEKYAAGSFRITASSRRYTAFA